MSFNLFKNHVTDIVTGRVNRMPEIIGDLWLNSPPLTFMELRGKVVLVDFWTYSCVNCQRTLPYLRDWWHKYRRLGFLLIGIHTPEFEFEKIPRNVEQAIRDLNVDWPVVLDNNRINWTNYNNNYWPAKYLADWKGNIVYTHFGEGNYTETEEAIRELLQEIDDGQLPTIKTENKEHTHGDVCFLPTDETYCGYTKGPLINAEGYVFDEAADYQLEADLEWEEGLIGLQGQFLAAPEYVESQQVNSSLFLSFHATEVNLVLRSDDPGTIVEIRLDHQPLYDEIRGHDVNQKGEVVIDKPRMYNLIKARHDLSGLIEVKAKQGRFQAYAFTFSGCS